MSVDYRHCSSCEESLYDEYVGSCTKCGNNLCTSCLINDDVKSRFAHHYGYKFDSKNEELIKTLIEEGFSLEDKDGKPYYKDGDIVDDSSILPKYCPYCSGNEIDREKVLDHLLKKYKLDIKKVWKEIK